MTSRILIFVLGLLAIMEAGCASMMHDLQPHRLRRLNRHPAPSVDPEFSARPTLEASSVGRDIA